MHVYAYVLHVYNFTGAISPDEKYALSASNLRKKFAATAKSSSLDIESGGWSTSPKESPVSITFCFRLMRGVKLGLI